MKQKSKNRFLAALLAAAMMFQLLPLMVFAEEGAPSDVTLKSTGKSYSSLKEAVEAASDTDTITLGTGEYSLYNVMSTTKSLTFVGQGPDNTLWQIGAEVPDPSKYGTERNGDYSFDGADTVTFRNMTLRSGKADAGADAKLGFIRPNHTVVENCVVNGKTHYWGYKSAEFIDSVFNPPSGDYSVYVYSSAEATFDNCTFNASGKVINVYNDGGVQDVKVYFRNCKVTSKPAIKPAVNINDENMGSYKNTIYITDNDIEAATDKISCSKIFGFSGKASNNTGRTDVYLNGEHVWSEGKMLTHAYTDGEKEGKVTTTTTPWEKEGNHYKRHVTKTCSICQYKYCAEEEKDYYENGYKIRFDLGDCPDTGDDIYNSEDPQPEKFTLPKPSWAGHKFMGWKIANGPSDKVYEAGETITVTADTELIAVWEEDTTGEDTTPTGSSSGDAGAAVAITIGAAGAAVLGYHLGTALLAQHYGMPYLPKHRSELALMLWEDAGKPMPDTQALYTDVSQEEQDLQCAARWARENDLLPDANKDDGTADQETQFSPDGRVSRARALIAWQKAQQLKKNA